MITCLIIDDEQQAIQRLEEMLGTFTEIKVTGKVTDPLSALPVIRELDPDVLFLDIQMPGKDGFELLGDIVRAGLKPCVVFVTAFNEFAIRALRNEALDYLLKPVDRDELSGTVQRIRRFIAEKNPGWQDRHLQEEPTAITEFNKIARLLSRLPVRAKLKFATGSGFTMFHPEEIFYILADWNYSELVLANSKRELITMNLGSLEKMLPREQFYRVNRSIIINISFLTRVNRKKREGILIKDGESFAFRIPLLNIRKMERFLEGER